MAEQPHRGGGGSQPAAGSIGTSRPGPSARTPHANATTTMDPAAAAAAAAEDKAKDEEEAVHFASCPAGASSHTKIEPLLD